jgi:FtsH-binding integral membrane protein
MNNKLNFISTALYLTSGALIASCLVSLITIAIVKIGKEHGVVALLTFTLLVGVMLLPIAYIIDTKVGKNNSSDVPNFARD